MALLRFDNSVRAAAQGATDVSGEGPRVLHEERFQHQLACERKRSERSQRPILLLLIESRNSQDATERPHDLSKAMSALAPEIRGTDSIGWYRENTTGGVIFTELPINDKNAILSTILQKLSTILNGKLTATQFCQLTVSFHFFPDDWGEKAPGGGSNDPALYPDAATTLADRRFTLAIKRCMDIVLSSLVLLICSPLFLIIIVAIKSTSKGPAFFTQQRVGQYGRHFNFLKFRSMEMNNDCTVHREYVSALIAGRPVSIATKHTSAGVYKLANDHRITRVGKFLRRTSLDELPQLINVLRGEMSLVGPRPPIPYELAAYQVWHRRRLLEVKPGITGLWQIKGRSRVSFDDMVRMDLTYVRTWSLWLDLKILCQTPAAVLKGAY